MKVLVTIIISCLLGLSVSIAQKSTVESKKVSESKLVSDKGAEQALLKEEYLESGQHIEEEIIELDAELGVVEEDRRQVEEESKHELESLEMEIQSL